MATRPPSAATAWWPASILDSAPAAWSTLGRLGRCHDSVYHETFSDKIDGVLDVSFTVPHRNMSGESTKELSLDLEARVSTCVSV